jgi:hypothetical protein
MLVCRARRWLDSPRLRDMGETNDRSCAPGPAWVTRRTGRDATRSPLGRPRAIGDRRIVARWTWATGTFRPTAPGHRVGQADRRPVVEARRPTALGSARCFREHVPATGTARAKMSLTATPSGVMAGGIASKPDQPTAELGHELRSETNSVSFLRADSLLRSTRSTGDSPVWAYVEQIPTLLRGICPGEHSREHALTPGPGREAASTREHFARNVPRAQAQEGLVTSLLAHRFDPWRLDPAGRLRAAVSITVDECPSSVV